MATIAGHSFYIHVEPIGSFYNQVNDTGSSEPLVFCIYMYLITDINCSMLWKQISRIFRNFLFCMYFFQDMTKKMQAHRDEHKMQMDQIKGVSTNVPSDNKFKIYQQISYG